MHVIFVNHNTGATKRTIGSFNIILLVTSVVLFLLITIVRPIAGSRIINSVSNEDIAGLDTLDRAYYPRICDLPS